MKKSFARILKRKWVLWTGIALAALLLIGFGFSLLFFQPWLRKKLETEIKEKSGGIYSVEMGNLKASLLGGSLSIQNLALRPDTAKWMEQNKAGQADLTSRLIELKAQKLKISSVNYLGLLLNKPLKLGQVELVQPVMHINQMKTDTTASEPLHLALKGPLANMEVKKIRIENGTFSYKKNRRHQYNTAKISGLNLETGQIKFDSIAYKAPDRIFYARQLKASVQNSNILLPSGLSRLKTGQATLTAETGLVKLQKVTLKPVVKPAELARRKGEATNWIEVQIPEILLEEADLAAFSKNGNVAIATVTVKEPRMKVFKDKQNFTPKTTRPLPHDLVQQFKAGLHIGKIKITKMNLRYDELAEEAKKTGYLALYNLNATITNVTNDKTKISAKNPAIARVSFSIMGKGNLNASIRLPLLDPSGKHTVTGKINNADLNALNPIIERAYFVSFKSGYIRNGSFNFNLNRTSATGKMELNYSDFEIDLLNKEEEKKQSLPKKVLSKIANKTVVKEENPAAGKGMRTAEINVTRQKNRSVFTYWKDCLEEGLLVSVGLEKFKP